MAAEGIDNELKKQQVKLQKAFRNLNDNETDILASLLIEKKYKAGDVVVKEGDRVDSVYLIVHGDADVFRSEIVDDKPQANKVATLHAGNAIGLSDVGFYSLTGLRTATVIASSDLITYQLSVSIFRGFTLAYPHANEVMRKQAENLL